jgi:hypothetical protein
MHKSTKERSTYNIDIIEEEDGISGEEVESENQNVKEVDAVGQATQGYQGLPRQYCVHETCNPQNMMK